uniref:DUF362 domain-containing protein n=1 Tax=candidate division WOR-3 bacterium TaxID=2052148 RepID=A0A7C3YRU5_UNCW3
MKSKVYFLPLTNGKNPDAENIKRFNSFLNVVFKETKFLSSLSSRKRIGIKVHFGEEGRENYLKPEYVREVSLFLGQDGHQPFLLESATLYQGMRQEEKTHFLVAQKHGFTLKKVLAPIIFVDGKKGESYYEIGGKKIGQKLRLIKFLINLAHFKGHLATGFGGALKSIGMGLAAKGGKLEMHSVSIPYIDESKCTFCGSCAEYCPREAIRFHQTRYLITNNCVGCCGCLTVCPNSAIKIKWNTTSEELQSKIAEFAHLILKDRHTLHFNFLIDITPNCDCLPKTEEPIMPDIGILASLDPVALDQASYDMTKDKIKEIYPNLNPEIILQQGEEMGIGQREYELYEV